MEQSGTSEQLIAQPKGGGAVRALGESFTPDLQTGTGRFAVPIEVPVGRNGLEPELVLRYSSAEGNGPFGLGWDVPLAGVARSSTRGVPRYRGVRAPLAERDSFLLSGAEELVPVEEGPVWTRYRPRTEALFARILHRHGAGDDHWEVCGKDGMISRYGTRGSAGVDPAVIAFPDAARASDVAAWKLTSTEDPFGNRILYDYLRDRAAQDGRRWDQLYPKRIRYVDYDAPAGAVRYLVSVEFEYAQRPDPFSSYRFGFEVRTRLRCTAIHVRVHHAGALPVRTYRLTYLDERTDLADLAARLPANGVSLLSRIQVIGYDDAGRAYDGTVRVGERRELQSPPLELGYTAYEPARQRFAPVTGDAFPPRSLAEADVELADLFGDGLPDIVEMNGNVRYWRNVGGRRFEPPRSVEELPAGISLARSDAQLLDADGDGRIDLLARRDGLWGYFPLALDRRRPGRAFRRYAHGPTFKLDDPELDLVDLDGDGVTDAVRAGTRFELYFNDARRGWEPAEARRVGRGRFPDVRLSDPRVRWADMTGDGLQDLVMLHDGNVEYWPNHGYGDWGARVHMRASPRLPLGYDSGQLLLGDVDGDGAADLVLVEDRQVTVWINRSGNGFGSPIRITGTPPVAGTDAVRLEDLDGGGVRGVLWSANATALGRPSMFFLDITGGRKPYLLNEIDNRMGARTAVTYASSVEDDLADRRDAGRRWAAGVPFPVQVVRRIETTDAITGRRAFSSYRYHHGSWDGGEREFRGFGMVEQTDADVAAGSAPPTLMRTWFHTGVVGEEHGDWRESWPPDPLPGTWTGDAPMLARSVAQRAFLAGLPRRARRDALRALRAAVLRTELYALDGSTRESRPYRVTESLHEVREVVDAAGAAHALHETPRPGDAPGLAGLDAPRRVFFPCATAERTTRWDRGDDPQTRFQFTTEFDVHGQPRAQTMIACPRGWRTLADTPAQPYLASRTRTEHAVPDDPALHVADRVARTTTWEMTATAGMTVAAVRDLADTDPALVVVAQRLQYYDGSAFTGLPLRRVGRYGALVRAEELVLDDRAVQDAYGPRAPPHLTTGGAPAWGGEYPQTYRQRLGAGAGHRFVSDPDHTRGWFVDRERRRYDVHAGAGRGLVVARLDPLGRESTARWDGYDLLPEEVRAVLDPARAPPGDALVTTAVHNYRAMQARRIVDPAGSVREFAFTPLGLLAAAWVKGRAAGEGDTTEPAVRLEYDLLAFHRSARGAPRPAYVRTVRRRHHDSDSAVPLPERDGAVDLREYSDGFGRLVQSRTLAPAIRYGDALHGGGDAVLPSDQAAGAGGDVAGVVNGDAAAPNVIVSGWQEYDGKGRVVVKYEPSFAAGWDYTRSTLARLRAVRLEYDPNGQVIRTVTPDGSEQRIVNGIPAALSQPDTFAPSPWETYTYDANDLDAVSAAPARPGAAPAPATHHFTPRNVEVDALGRVVRVVERGGPAAADRLTTVLRYDLAGNLLRVDGPAGRTVLDCAYDRTGRRLRVTGPESGTRRSAFDAAGNLVEQRDDRGALTLRAYDALNRIARVWARDGGGEPVTLRERLIYGDEPSAPAAPDRYLRGRLYRHYDEAGLLTYRSYDFHGNVRERIRRPLSEAALLAPFASPPPSWSVRPFRVDWRVHGSAGLEPALAIDYGYDALGNMTSLRQPQDADGERKLMRVRHDSLSRPVRVELDGEVCVERVAYDARGERILVVYGNGVMTRFAWDPFTFRMRRARTERCTAPAALTYRGTADPAQVLQDTAYVHDPAGNLVALHQRTRGSGVAPAPDRLDRAFTYDALYRLLTAGGRECGAAPTVPWESGPRCRDLTLTRRYDETYVHDDAGNLRSIRHAAGSGSVTRMLDPAAGSDRIAQLRVGGSPAADYAHDAAGNLIREGSSRHFEYDHADRLRVYRTQVPGAEPSVHVIYLYDAAGALVKRLVRKGAGRLEATTYLDGACELLRLVRPSGTLEHQVLAVEDAGRRLLERRVGPAFPGDGAGSAPFLYTLTDHLGSQEVTVGGADARSRSFVRREEYTPYGQTCFGGYGRKRYRFAGKERDDASGLCRFGARWYAPWLGRWTSCDPTVAPDAPNRYAYVRGSPLVLRDPDGRLDMGGAASGTATGEATQLSRSLGGVRAARPPPGGGLALLVGAAVVGAMALWIAFWLRASQRAGDRAEERVRRAVQAENLREEGLISWEESNQYIITGQLFIPKEQARDRSLEDAYRAKWFELGREFQQHVLDTVLKRLYDAGQLEVEFDTGTVTGTRKPDFSRWDPRVPGQFLWIGDAKLGRIELDDQMKGLIDEATRTTYKMLILFTPEGVVIPKSVIEAAKKAGISIIQIEVPFMPEYVPRADGARKESGKAAGGSKAQTGK